MKIPIAPPSASISRTICPLATPPIAGLQLIWPTVSQFIVKRGRPPPSARRQRRLEPGVAGADCRADAKQRDERTGGRVDGWQGGWADVMHPGLDGADGPKMNWRR